MKIAIGLLSLFLTLSAFAQGTLESTQSLFRSLSYLEGIGELFREGPGEEYSRYIQRSLDDIHQVKGTKLVSADEVLSTIRSKKIVFLSDFHPYDELHTKTIEVIHDLAKNSTKQKIFIAEFIHPSVQKILDQYIDGSINPTSEELMLLVKHPDLFFSSFEWKTFFPILEALRSHKIKTLAVMAPEVSTSWVDIYGRDAFTHKSIEPYLADEQNQLIFMHGYYHLFGEGIGATLAKTYPGETALIAGFVPYLEFDLLKFGLDRAPGKYLEFSSVHPNSYYYPSRNLNFEDTLWTISFINDYLKALIAEEETRLKLDAAVTRIGIAFSGHLKNLTERAPADVVTLNVTKVELRKYYTMVDEALSETTDAYYLNKLKPMFERIQRQL